MCARLDRRFRGGRTAAEATHARLLAFWRWPEHRDLFEPLRAWERRHALPLIVYGLTVGIIHKGPIGAPSLHELAIAIPYSLALISPSSALGGCGLFGVFIKLRRNL